MVPGTKSLNEAQEHSLSRGFGGQSPSIALALLLNAH